ncbi:MAG: DUF4123 domain-containing protein, partial [Pirellulaceae bacterium]
MAMSTKISPPPWARLASMVDSGQNLLALMDTCEEPEVQEMIPAMGARAQSLYQGRTQQQFSGIAPYLVQMDRHLLQWMEEDLAGRPWGFFLIPKSPHQMASIRKHFRRFLLVDDPDGQELYFRFYDPRVIIGFLECCSSEELQQWMSPLREILVPTADAWHQMVAPEPPDCTSNSPSLRFQMTRRHFEALQEQQIDQFVMQTIQRWQSRFPESYKALAVSTPNLSPLLRDAIDRAENYGVIGEADVELFLDCICLLGNNF